MKLFFKIIGGVIFFGALAFVTLKLFQPELVSKWQEKVENMLSGNAAIVSDHELVIVYPEDVSSLSPLSYSTVNRSRLLNVYEGLVRINKNLGIEPALAQSFGSVDGLSWEFTLRENVKFHDGSSLDIDDVLSSFEMAMDAEKSEIAGLLAGIDKIEKNSDSVLRIKTRVPDPLLPSKVAAVLIFPAEKKDQIVSTPVGTGAYRFVNYENGKFVKLELFENYWGPLPKYRFVSINTVPSKQDRFSQANEGRIDLLAAVPIDSVKELEGAEVKVLSQPSLEINFLIFNLKEKEGNIFYDKKIRQALTYALDKHEIVTFMSGYAQRADQFASRGIFGYTADIKARKYNFDLATKQVKEVSPFFRLNTTLDLVQGPEVFGDYIKKQLFSLGIDVELNYLPPKEFEEKLKKAQSDFYFLGWRSEFGDVSDFMASVVHSKTKDGRYGQFNGTDYKDEKLDTLIEKSEQIIDEAERLSKLQEIMKKIVSDDVIGIPLFETEVIYGVKNGIAWSPRMDGYILASEVQ